ncbi:PBECR2 nuclease fold domain-containing protein [Herbaspirillum chlorophenolicum]|uniref:PBECR2 nuclease fold domain-containing protein n=1 Tax=Herbaspirillum chlorophenolicum TaxID=211589 RepID=UPI00067E4A52|nr:PBECR2 nuclease fold domain-containing protein [Herbaspirillum chlorophenolicum]
MATSPDRLPFSEAIDFFQKKIQLPSSGWTDIWQEQHSHAYVVAGATHDALVEDFYNAIRKVQTEGTGYPAFRKQFDEIVAKHGWAHNGSPGWRSKVIYDTNISQAYSAGRYKQMMAVKHLRPFWRYRHTSTEHPRMTHLSWDGLILPADDPWFDSHMPQNGWGCKCKVDSLSRTEAARAWEGAGKSGPDEAPPIEWEERVVGKNGSAPRLVRTPVGIDPGFAYNPGKAWLEPQTVPPLQGYDAVLKERGAAWPTGFKPPSLPTPTMVPKSVLLPAGTAPEVAVSDFLDVFGASMEQGAVFTDSAGSSLAVTKALFQDGAGEFKWLSKPDKASRLEYINMLAMTLIEPDEIWWTWVKDGGDAGRWRLKRRYLRAFELEGSDEYGVGVFEWGKTGWTGATTFMSSQKTEKAREAYFDKQRNGRLVFKK